MAFDRRVIHNIGCISFIFLRFFGKADIQEEINFIIALKKAHKSGVNEKTKRLLFVEDEGKNQNLLTFMYCKYWLSIDCFNNLVVIAVMLFAIILIKSSTDMKP